MHERISSLSEAEALLLDGLHHAGLPGQPRPHPLALGHAPPPHPHQDGTSRHEKLVDFGDDYILPDKPRQPALRLAHKKEKKKKKPYHKVRRRTLPAAPLSYHCLPGRELVSFPSV